MPVGHKKRLHIFHRDGWRCRYCHKPVSIDVPPSHPDRATIDHIIPLSRGGSGDEANLATACPECNHTKGNTLPSGVRPQRPTPGVVGAAFRARRWRFPPPEDTA